MLDAEFKQHGYKVPTISSPDIGVKFMGLFDKTVKLITPMLSRVSALNFVCREKEDPCALSDLTHLLFFQVINLNTRRMTNVLGVTARDPKSTVIEMAYSMIEKGMVKKAKGYKGPPVT